MPTLRLLLCVCVAWLLQEERAISPVGTLEYMPPEILRLPSTDLVVKGLVSVDGITPVDEKVRCWLLLLACVSSTVVVYVERPGQHGRHHASG
jgi:hypothetical protein